MRVPTSGQNESIIVPQEEVEDPVAFDTATLPAELPDEFTIETSWSEGERIPVQFTCQGTNTSPSLSWFDTPAEAVGIAVIFYQGTPEAVETTIHWILANLDTDTAYLDSAVLDVPESRTDIVFGLNEVAANGSPIAGYSGPCPGPGTSATYTLEVHALGQLVELPTGSPAKDLRSAIDLVSIARASITAYAQG